MADQKRPLPSQIDTSRGGAVPFTACFGRTEREIAAAIYVEGCRARGDVWQPISPRHFGETLIDLVRGRIVDPAPSWALFVVDVGLIPDVPGLVDGGWLTKDDDQRVEPTDAFFEAVRRFTLAEVRRG